MRENPRLKMLEQLNAEIVACRRCPRLRQYCEAIAKEKRRAYRDQEYWGKPVPGFGDPDARVLVVGLAPGAHGANRTGRMFTGDRSGDFLYRALFETGFASQPESISREDGLQLRGLFISASGRCAPPDNKPTTEELAHCRPYLERELAILDRVRVVVTLGAIAHRTYLSILRDLGHIKSLSDVPFSHGGVHRIGPAQPVVISSYHPSQQNTSTGRLTREMLREIFQSAAQLAGKPLD